MHLFFSLPVISVFRKIRFCDLVGQVPKVAWHKSYEEKKWVRLKLYFYLTVVDQVQDVCGQKQKMHCRALGESAFNLMFKN